VLRISHERVTAKEVRLVVEGRLLGPWVIELEKTCEPFLGNGRRLQLDLSQVWFADRAGVALLGTLAGQGADLDCSPFLTELLRDATPETGASGLSDAAKPHGQS
jgi:ABC-type transporter Mla MlaB component